MRPISRLELQAKLAAGERVTLIEALPATYYRDAHLPGAINLPHDQVDQLAPTLLPDKSATIVTYCSNRACPNCQFAAILHQRFAAKAHQAKW